jgi:prepilin-type N-terminal cleavage/methylation domain-containing protein
MRQLRAIMLKIRPLNDHGFTLPELISVMVVSLLFSGLIMYFGFEYWRASTTLVNDIDTFETRLTADDFLRNLMNASSGLMMQNSLPDQHTNNPDPADASNQYWIPIHAVPGTITMPASGSTTPLLYFRTPSQDSSKNIIMNGTQPYDDERVLYLNGATKQLLMRTLSNTNAPGDAAKTTCPTGQTSTTCRADKIIASDVSSVNTRYFSRSGNIIDYTSITDPITGQYIGPDFSAAEVIELTIHLSKKSTLKGGADSLSQTIIRVALRND